MHIYDNNSNILLSSDHNAPYLDFLPPGFENYIDKILATDGLIKKREKIFKKA